MEGCFSYCVDTCFRSVRFETPGTAMDGYTLKACEVDDSSNCSIFQGSRRGPQDPRSFIAHLPLNLSYNLVFLDALGREAEPTEGTFRYDFNACPPNSGSFSVTVHGKSVPTLAPVVGSEPSSPSDEGPGGPIVTLDPKQDNESSPAPNKEPTLAPTDEDKKGSTAPAPSPGNCFSSRMTVNVHGHGVVRMDELQVGDSVLAHGGAFSKVYAFGHLDSSNVAEFLHIHTSMNEPLEITADHLLYVRDKTTERVCLMPAGQVKIGDLLLTSHQAALAQVESIRKVKRRGIYAPFTSTGDIVVNGIVASNYIALPPTFTKHLSFDEQHLVQHGTYTPYRFYCLVTGGCESRDHATGLSIGVTMWLPLLHWLEEHSDAIPLFLNLVAAPSHLSLWLLEQILLNAVSIIAVVLGCYFICNKQLKSSNILKKK